MTTKRKTDGAERGHNQPIAPQREGERIAIDSPRVRIIEDGRGPGEVRAVNDATEPQERDKRDICPSLIKSIMVTAKRMFASDNDLSSHALEQLMADAIASSDNSYGVKEAVKWAEGYEFPQALVDSDLRLFRAAHLDFTKMVKGVLKKSGVIDCLQHESSY